MIENTLPIQEKGPDIICSMNGSGLKKLIEDSKRIIEFRGR